jgi:hypothetical protein
MALLEAAMVVAEVEVALIVAATTSSTSSTNSTSSTPATATATASNLPTALRIPHPTPALLPSPATRNRRSKPGSPTMGSNTRRKAHRTLPSRLKTTTPTTRRRFTSRSHHMADSRNTSRLLSSPTASLTQLRRRTTVLPHRSGVPSPNPRQPTEHMVAADAADVAATMIEVVPRAR